MMGIYDDYLNNTKAFVDALGKGHPKYLDVLTQQGRLQENIKKARSYGDPPELNAARSQIWEELNRLSLEIFNVPVENIGAGQPLEQTKSTAASGQSAKTDTAPPVKPATVPEQPAKNDGAQTAKPGGKLVFISHTKVDKPFVEKLKKDLNAAGLDVWYDKDSIQVGQSIPEEINKALSRCDYFLVVLTPDSLAAPWVSKEIGAAEMGNKKIMTVLLRECEIPPLLQQYKYADFSSDYQNGLSQLFGGLGVEPGKRDAGAKVDDEKDINFESPSSFELLFIFSIIEHPFYGKTFSPEQKQILKNLFTDVAMKKQKGEILMPLQTSENPGEILLYSSQMLAYHLLSLTEYHKKWPNLSIHNHTKSNSLALLGKMQEQILATSMFIQQITNTNRYSGQAERIVAALHALRQQFATIDKYLYTGTIPYEARDEIERHFSDVIFHLNNYILILDELAQSNTGKKWVQ